MGSGDQTQALVYLQTELYPQFQTSLCEFGCPRSPYLIPVTGLPYSIPLSQHVSTAEQSLGFTASKQLPLLPEVTLSPAYLRKPS